MNISELNLDVNTYTDARLQKNFGLADNYTKEDVIAATNRLASVASSTLGPNDEEAFNAFLRAAEERLLKRKMVESSSPAWTDQHSYLNSNELLPSDRELTIIPEQKTQINTLSQGTGVLATVSHTLPTNEQHKAPAQPPQPQPQAQPQPEPIPEPQATTANVINNTMIPLPVAPQPHEERWPQNNLKNITSRIVSIDSQYRQNISTIRADGQLGVDGAPEEKSPAFNSDFTLDLSEPLTNVVSMKLYSVQIPTTWYAFDHHLGNTSFSRNSDGTVAVRIAPGNYDLSGLTQAIKAADNSLTFAIDEATNIVDISGGTTTDPFVYYKEGGLVNSSQTCIGGTFINQNLGWNLGLRYAPDASGIASATLTTDISGHVPANTYGPKYFMLAIDDFNQNHHNKGLATMTDNYAPISAIQTSKNFVNGTQITKAQKYSQNAQLGYDGNGNVKKTTSRTPGPRSGDIFAMIPLKDITALRSNQEPLIVYDTALQSNLRTYSNPVDIERLRIRLLDDKGNLVNLHDNDWSFALVVEQVN